MLPNTKLFELISFPEDEKKKLFKTMNNRAIEMWENLNKHSPWNDVRISVKAYFQYQPFYNKKKWLLNYAEWTIPGIDFDIVKHYELEKYFTRIVYYNRNLKGREDVILREDTGGPIITFDMELTLINLANNFNLFSEQLGTKNRLEAKFDKFIVRYDFPDSYRYNEFLSIYHNRNVKFNNPLLEDKDLDKTFISGISQNALGKNRNDAMLQPIELKDSFLVDEWDQIERIKSSFIHKMVTKYLLRIK